MAKLSEKALAVALEYDESVNAQIQQAAEVNRVRRKNAVPGSWVSVYTEDGQRIVPEWKSAIVGGDELLPGGVYILQRTTSKAPVEFKLGHKYTALRTTDGEFSGEVIDQDYRTFVVDEGDLFTTY